MKQPTVTAGFFHNPVKVVKPETDDSADYGNPSGDLQNRICIALEEVDGKDFDNEPEK